TFTGYRPVCVTANHPVVAESNDYYFEVHIPEEQTEHPLQLFVAVGFSTTTGKFQEFPGWKSTFAPAAKSWAHHSDDGGYFHQNLASAFGEGYGFGDTIGAGVDLMKNVIFFTKNGKRLGEYPPT